VDDLTRHIPVRTSKGDTPEQPVSPTDAHVLGQVDGMLSVSDIADVLAQDAAVVLGVLEKLAARGLLELRAPRVSAHRATQDPSSAYSMRPEGPRRTRIPKPSATDGAAVVNTRSPASPPTAELFELTDPNIDLPMERRQEILDAFVRVQSPSYYDVLGLPGDATRAEVRALYFDLSKRFHPDTLYGKRLGGFKARMEMVFKRVTEAYEVLGRPKKRAEYHAAMGWPPPPAPKSLPPGMPEGASMRAPVPDTSLRAPHTTASPARKVHVEPMPAITAPAPRMPSAPAEVSPKVEVRSNPAPASTAAAKPSVPVSKRPSHASGPRRQQAETMSTPPSRLTARSMRPDSATSIPSVSPSNIPPSAKLPTFSGAPGSVPVPPSLSEPSLPPPRNSMPGAAPPSQPAATPPRDAVMPPASARGLTEADVDRKRRLIAEQLAKATRRAVPQGPLRPRPSPAAQVSRGSQPPAAAPPRRSMPAPAMNSVPVARREEMLKDLARSLKGVADFTGGVDRAQAHVEDARRAEAKGDLLGAKNALSLAIALSPERMEIQQEYSRVSAQLASQSAGDFETEAKAAEEENSWQEAAIKWSKVCEGKPDDPKVHLRAAEAMAKANLPLADAKRFAQRAVELDPENPKGYRVLGQVFASAGMKVNARKAYEEALRLDPKDENLKNLLKDLK
jgi:hypothetical protein